MTTTDPIADMLTRIRNANTSKHKTVDIPASNIKKSIADILFKEGYIKNGKKVIAGLKRISKPGLRVYAAKDELPKVLNGLGIALISTSKGIMTDRQARIEGVGGEVLAYIW